MQTNFSRRSLLELGAALGGLYVTGCASTAAPVRTRGRLRHAAVGVGGMGGSDLDQIRSHPDVDVVALCDVDSNRLQEAAKKVPGARLYRDWRELLAAEASAIDSLCVSTPDHMHAAVTLAALRLGKHVYCQKPLTRTVQEARAVAAAARHAGVVTQMGIQNHSNAPYSAALELLRAGHIGPVYEAHTWTDRPAGWWPQGVERPEGSDPVPPSLDWDLWLGVARERPFKKDTYHPFKWRGWKDFGTGAQGDMACHLMDAPVWFLELGAPLRIRSDGATPNAETYPLSSEVQYEFGATPWTTRGPLRFTWHDGKRKAPRELLEELGLKEVFDNGSLLVGEKGALLTSPYEAPQLLPAARFAEVAIPAGVASNHWHQWVEACLDRGEASASFEYAAHLSEIALLGNVALHFPHETLEWDGARGRFSNRVEANGLLALPQRQGWEVPELS